MKVVVHAEALRELREAREWYTKRLGAKRSARLVRSPYTIVFALSASESIVILAIAHGRRRPGYWAGRRSR